MASIQSALNSLIGSVSSVAALGASALSKSRNEEAKRAASVNVEADNKAIAEQNAAERVAKNIESQRNMNEGLTLRFDLLSAKQKRQVLDVAHKAAKKGAVNG